MTQPVSPFELDHLSILTRVDAPEAVILENLGLVRDGGVTQHEGTPALQRTHDSPRSSKTLSEANGAAERGCGASVGTAFTAFFFENAYLELLWAHDGELAQKKFSVAHYNLDARARWQDTRASPFGLMLRRIPGRASSPPFATEPFSFNNQPVEFAAQNSAEPACGFLPAALTYPNFKHTITNRAHTLGVKEITRVRINLYDEFQLSPLARWLDEHQIAIIQRAAYANLEIEFDHAAQGEAINLRPDLPLVLKY